MATAIRLRWTARWAVASAGAFLLSACASLDRPALNVPPTSRFAASAVSPLIQAGGQVRSGSGVEGVTPASAPLTLPQLPTASDQGKPLPINLPTALTLSEVNPVDVRIAGERLRVAAAQLEQARVLWLPSLTLGFDYNRHDGQIQNADGTISNVSRSSMMFGAGSGIGNTALLNVNDAIFAPLVARRTMRARQADQQAAQNDVMVAVAEAYFNVQQARGEAAGSIDALRRAEALVNLTEKLAPDIAPTLEVNRARTEVARRRLAVETAYERWEVASAELTRLLRLEPGTLVEPVEPPELRMELIDPLQTVDDLIPIALTHRPELASRQAQVQTTLALLRQEKLRPLVPSVLIRGWSTPVTGTLAAGVFAGGTNGTIGNVGLRGDVDAQLLWQFDNLGFGNRARTHQREAENRLALVELFRMQDLVAAEVVQAHAQLRRAANRVKAANEGVVNAVETAEKNLRGLVPGRKIGDRLALVSRPQEAVAAVTALDQAYRDYYAAVADQNRAQFRLYRALGHPARCLTGMQTSLAPPPAVTPSASSQSVVPTVLTPNSQPVVTTAPPTAPTDLPASPIWKPVGSTLPLVPHP